MAREDQDFTNLAKKRKGFFLEKEEKRATKHRRKVYDLMDENLLDEEDDLDFGYDDFWHDNFD